MCTKICANSASDVQVCCYLNLVVTLSFMTRDKCIDFYLITFGLTATDLYKSNIN